MPRQLALYACCGGTLTSGHQQDCKQAQATRTLDTEGLEEYLREQFSKFPRGNT